MLRCTCRLHAGRHPILPSSGEKHRPVVNHSRSVVGARTGPGGPGVPGAAGRVGRMGDVAVADLDAARASRDAAVRRIAVEVSNERDLTRIFDDVLDHSVSLFEADKAGLWTVEDGDNPFRLAAHRGLGPTFLAAVAGIRRGSRAAGWRAVTERRTIVLAHPWSTVSPTELVDGYDDEGFRTICLVPVAYLDEPLGLLALYHTRPTPGPGGPSSSRIRRPGGGRAPERPPVCQRPRVRSPPRRDPGPRRR